MKYEMPALTDEQREEIEQLCIEAVSERPIDREERLMHLIAQIALSALTLKPIYQERRFHVKGKLQIEYWADVGKSEYQYIHESQRRIIYTEPPVPVLEQQENIKHVGYLFVNAEGAVIYSPSGFGISGFTCAGKIYGDVNFQPTTDTYRQIENDGWIEWGGGAESPVAGPVEVRYRNGRESNSFDAGDYSWVSDLGGLTIIAYRVIEND